MFKIKRWYLRLLEDRRNFLESIFYFFLLSFSYLYRISIFLRNFLYDKEILPSDYPSKKVISVGSLSWAGSGKTTLSIWLYEKLSLEFRLAVLRRGYGEDENNLLRERGIKIYASVARDILASKLSGDFDIFILDDGFQYRKLKKNCEIVILGPQDLKKTGRLIPASNFREPLSSLKRADILVLNYKSRMKDIQNTEEYIKKRFPQIKIYKADYKLKRFITLDGKERQGDYFKERKIAALTAIGYPDGFFDKLAEVGIEVADKIKYPDHYELSEREFTSLKDNLIKRGIKDLLITSKDKYHLPQVALQSDLNIFIMEIDMEIEDENNFLHDIEDKLNK